MNAALLLISFFHVALSANDCAWFIGQLKCSKPNRLANTVVEIWDHDRSVFPISLFVDDDLAGRTIISEEDNGTFNVEGCASDLDFLFVLNRPEFYLRIRHSCRGKSEVINVQPKNRKIFLPETNDYFMTNPINLG